MTRKEVTHICEKCGKIEWEERTWKSRVKTVFKVILISSLILTSIVGSVAIYNFIIGGIYDNPDLMISTGGALATINNIWKNFHSKGDREELREIALNLTQGCNDDKCRAEKIFVHLSKFTYEVTSNENKPLKTWESKIGDCDTLSYLYMTLLKELDISSMMQCTDTHCYLIIKLENQKILADITFRKWEEY